MTVLNFSNYARRTPTQGATSVPQNTAPVTDRWAALHTAAPATASIATLPVTDYWGDLQLRMAYPTLHMRHGG